MKKYLLFISLFVSTVFASQAQQVVLAQDVAKDSVQRNFGPNRRHFTHLFVGYGLVAGASEAGSEIKYLNSHEWQFGFRYKFKVSNFYALGLEATLNPQTYYLKQTPEKTLPNFIQHDVEKLKFTNAGLGFYNRFNFGKRGNYIGNFLDLGIYGNWMPVKAHIYQDDDLFGLVGSLSGVKNVKVRENGLKYVEDFNYGVLARLGFNRYVFYGSYRLSNLFGGYAVLDGYGNNLFGFAELPRLTVGFQLSFHK